MFSSCVLSVFGWVVVVTLAEVLVSTIWEWEDACRLRRRCLFLLNSRPSLVLNKCEWSERLYHHIPETQQNISFHSLRSAQQSCRCQGCSAGSHSTFEARVCWVLFHQHDTLAADWQRHLDQLEKSHHYHRLSFCILPVSYGWKQPYLSILLRRRTNHFQLCVNHFQSSELWMFYFSLLSACFLSYICVQNGSVSHIFCMFVHKPGTVPFHYMNTWTYSRRYQRTLCSKHRLIHEEPWLSLNSVMCLDSFSSLTQVNTLIKIHFLYFQHFLSNSGVPHVNHHSVTQHRV